MKGSVKIVLCACGLCVLAAFLLLGGIDLYATSGVLDGKEEENTKIVTPDETYVDEVARAISQSGTVVPIISVAESYIEGGWATQEEIDSGEVGMDEGLDPVSGEITKEEALQIGTTEITRVFGDSSFEGMTATLTIEDLWTGTDLEGNRIWYGELLNNEKYNATTGISYDYYYSFTVDTVSGEIYSCSREVGEGYEEPEMQEKMSDEEIFYEALGEVTRLSLLKDGELSPEEKVADMTMASDNYSIYNESDYADAYKQNETSSYYENDVIYYINGEDQYLQVFFDWRTGAFEGYQYYVENKTIAR